MRLCAAALPLLLLAGCAVRMGEVEHYVGPVLFRFRAPDATVGAVNQVVRLGLSAEVGRQWGVAAGVVDRVAVVAASPATANGEPGVVTPHWRMPLSFLRPPAAGEWNLSLLYLRVEGMPRAMLVMRRMYGVETTMGTETNAASIGWTARTLVEPPDDAFSVVRFDSRRPMETVAVTWSEHAPPDPAAWISNKEVAP